MPNDPGQRRVGTPFQGYTLDYDEPESERWKSFTYDEQITRDKVNLDITWLKDDALEDRASAAPSE